MIIGESIRKFRKEMNLTQDEFAARLSMHGRQLARYEVGRSIPSIEIIKKIADFCEVSIDYLVCGQDKKMADRAKINDREVLDLLRRIDRLKRPQRDKLKWAIQGLLTNGKER